MTIPLKNDTITAISGLKVGHTTDERHAQAVQ